MTILTLSRFGRDNFAGAMALANRVDESEIDWSSFKYMVFDIPNHQGAYKERYEHLGMPVLTTA